MVERSSFPPFPTADNSLTNSGTQVSWFIWEYKSRAVFSANLVLWMSVLWGQRSINAGTREAIGAEELGAGAGGVKWPLCHQLTTAVAQLPSVLLFYLSLLSRVFGSHTTFYCLPDLTTLEHTFLFTPSSFILQFSSKTGHLKLIGKFIYTQSVLWLITTSQVFARATHSLLSLLFCLQQCWFSLVKLWIKVPNNPADIKYLSVITEQSLFYPNIQFFYHVCM